MSYDIPLPFTREKWNEGTMMITVHDDAMTRRRDKATRRGKRRHDEATWWFTRWFTSWRQWRDSRSTRLDGWKQSIVRGIYCARHLLCYAMCHEGIYCGMPREASIVVCLASNLLCHVSWSNLLCYASHLTCACCSSTTPSAGLCMTKRMTLTTHHIRHTNTWHITHNTWHITNPTSNIKQLTPNTLHMTDKTWHMTHHESHTHITHKTQNISCNTFSTGMYQIETECIIWIARDWMYCIMYCSSLEKPQIHHPLSPFLKSIISIHHHLNSIISIPSNVSSIPSF